LQVPRPHERWQEFEAEEASSYYSAGFSQRD
jgi:hypothetical protein